MIVDDLELPIAYVPIKGSGVDALNNRKEAGSPVEITEAELRANWGKVREQNLRFLKTLIDTPIRTP